MAILVGTALAAGAVALYAGAYDVAATGQHVRPTFWLLETALRQSVRLRARGIEVRHARSCSQGVRALAIAAV